MIILNLGKNIYLVYNMFYTRVNKEKKEVHVIYDGVMENLLQSYKLFSVLDNSYFTSLFNQNFTLCLVDIYDFSNLSYIDELDSIRRYFKLDNIKLYTSITNLKELSYAPEWLDIIPSNSFFWHINYRFGWDVLITKKREPNYHRVKKNIGFWNRKPKLGRLFLIGKINFKESIYDYRINDFPNKKSVESLLKYFQGPEDYLKTINLGKSKLGSGNIKESKLLTASNQQDEALQFYSNTGLYQSVFVNLVSETLSDYGVSSNRINSKGIFITEKVAKPMIRFRPFLVHANPNYYRRLKALGFQTFDKYWDESFDSEFNFEKRTEKFLNTLSFIENIKLSSINKILTDMDSILKSNFNVLMDYMNSTPDYNIYKSHDQKEN